MKFSESWLREWVNPGIDSNALSEQLSMAGLEVDGVEPVAGEFSGVVVGHVVECGKHPEADKLQVTKVDVGEEELLDIVCGAKNCRQGLKVAVAKVGAVLPGDFKIKKAKLRGQPSFGMLCSESELGMADEAPGIMELPQDAVIGTCIREYLTLDDVTIEVDLTPNRADCLGLAGLAREVGVLNSIAVNTPAINPVAPVIDEQRSIHLDAPDACPRYLGRVIRNINPQATTPLWMVEKLRRSGIRSIDPVVDVTNYVLLELGHPMHAFDLDKLEGDIHVRMANDKEKLTLLDGNEVELADNVLVIADEQKAVAMAGIFGGEHTGVTAESQHIFLESAFFTPSAIKGRARQFGLHTDASHRYERGVDYQLQRSAMERATGLLLDIVGGEAGPVVEAEAQDKLPAQSEITLRRERLDRVIGHHIDDEKVTDILTRLGLEVTGTSGEWAVKGTSYRFDLSIEEDLIEEVARVYGYNNIPNVAPLARLKMPAHRESDLVLSRAKHLMVDLGYQEAITYSFVDPKVQDAMFPSQKSLVLPNPISSDMSAMRVSLWPGLLQTVQYNVNRQQPRVRVFETGLRFLPDENAENGIHQQPMLAGVITGLKHDEHWSMETAKADFFDLKGDVEALLSLSDSDAFTFKAGRHEALHPGQTAEIYRNGQLVGHIGSLHPSLNKVVGVKSGALLFEIQLDALSPVIIPEAQAVSKFPANRRDIALVVDEGVFAGDVLGEIRKVGGNQLVGLKLFDVYQGQGIEPGKKSLAIAMVLQDVERTLEEKDIADIVERVVNHLGEQFSASLRD